MRDVGGLVFLQQEHLIAAGDARGAGNHHPVLGAVMVHLQRQHATRAHRQALHLEALAAVEAVVAAPGPEHLAMQRVLVAPGAP